MQRMFLADSICRRGRVLNRLARRARGETRTSPLDTGGKSPPGSKFLQGKESASQGKHGRMGGVRS